MTSKQIIDMITSFTDDVILYYGDEMIFINPCSNKEFIFSYKDIDKTYTSIEDLMSDKIFDGKTLSDIASEVTLT